MNILSQDSEDIFVLPHASRYISEATRLMVAISPSGSRIYPQEVIPRRPLKLSGLRRGAGG